MTGFQLKLSCMDISHKNKLPTWSQSAWWQLQTHRRQDGLLRTGERVDIVEHWQLLEIGRFRKLIHHKRLKRLPIGTDSRTT